MRSVITAAALIESFAAAEGAAGSVVCVCAGSGRAGSEIAALVTALRDAGAGEVLVAAPPSGDGPVAAAIHLHRGSDRLELPGALIDRVAASP